MAGANRKRQRRGPPRNQRASGGPQSRQRQRKPYPQQQQQQNQPRSRRNRRRRARAGGKWSNVNSDQFAGRPGIGRMGTALVSAGRLFDAFRQVRPVRDSYTYGHFTPCRSYVSFGVSTSWTMPVATAGSNTLTAGSTTNTASYTALQDICLWLNWMPNGISAILFATTAGGTGTNVQMIGAPQFFPTTTTGSGATTTAVVDTKHPLQVRPMRTSIRITCTTPPINRAGGVAAVIIPQNITLPVTLGTGGFTGYGSTNVHISAITGSTTPPPIATTEFGMISQAAIQSITPLLSGQGGTFVAVDDFHKPHQWNIPPASFMGYHTYEPWQDVITPDASPSIFSGFSLTAGASAANVCQLTDLNNFATSSALNMSNALFIFRGSGFANPQTYNVEISHMIAGRFSANSLLANSAIPPAPDPGNSLGRAAAALSNLGAHGQRTQVFQ